MILLKEYLSAQNFVFRIKKVIRSILPFIIFLFSINQVVLCQLSKGGKPESFSWSMQNNIPVVTMPYIDNEKMIKQELDDNGNLKPGVFAVPFMVNISPETHGVWQNLPNGKRVWRVAVLCENAFSVNLIFSEYRLNDGVQLFLYGADMNNLLGAFTKANNKSFGSLATEPIKGEKITVEMVLDKNVVDYGSLTIGQVAHDYKNFFKNTLAGYKSGSCNVNVRCEEGDDWKNEKDAVCKLVINGWETCTGVLINNVNNDAAPYVLTANHCLSSTSKTNNSVYIFRYEGSGCYSESGDDSKSISGAQLLSTYNKLDFSLVKLSSRIPHSFHPFFAGWSCDTVPPPYTVTIHHPDGDIKKISIDEDPPTIDDYPYDVFLDKNAFWKISDWETGTTEPGSSGCPLFDNQHRIIGDLTGGDAYCGNSINDFFCVFRDSYMKYDSLDNRHLRPWLDPDSTGVKKIDGFKPYSEVAADCYTLSNIEMYEFPVLFNHEGSWGYWTGHNADTITAFAEKFVEPYNDTISGLYINTGQIKITGDSSTIDLIIWKGSEKPMFEYFRQEIDLNTLVDSTTNFIDIGPVYLNEDTFFIGYEINYYDSGSVFSVMHSPDRGALGKNTLFMYNDTGWASVTEISQDEMSLSLDVEPISCGYSPYTGVKEETIPFVSTDFILYPNPARNIVNLQFNEPLSNVNISMISLTGQCMKMQHFDFIDRTIEIHVEDTEKGIYFLHVCNTNMNKTKKLIIVE